MFEEDRERETNAIIMWDWKSLFGNKSHRNIFGPQRLWEIRAVKFLWTLVKGKDLSSASRGVSCLREGCTTGQHQEIEVHIIWTIYLRSVDSETLWRICKTLEQLLTLTTNCWLRRSAWDWRKSYNFRKGTQRWDLEKLYAQREKVQDTLEKTLGAIECESGDVRVQWNDNKYVC